ncbi:hypothetical protein NQ317_014372, partial [Molorchus minor]
RYDCEQANWLFFLYSLFDWERTAAYIATGRSGPRMNPEVPNECTDTSPPPSHNTMPKTASIPSMGVS